MIHLSEHVKWVEGAQWLSGRALDSRPKGRRFEPNRRHCVVSLSKNINPSLVLVQPRKTRPFITERLLMGRKESNQTNKIKRVELDTQQVIVKSYGQHNFLEEAMKFFQPGFYANASLSSRVLCPKHYLSTYLGEYTTKL